MAQATRSTAHGMAEHFGVTPETMACIIAYCILEIAGKTCMQLDEANMLLSVSDIPEDQRM